MTAFLLPLLGGALIGIAAALLLLFNGRIAGVSGIAGGLVSPSPGDTLWRAAFLGGLWAGGGVLTWVLPQAFGAPAVPGLWLLVLSGLLVGVGTRLGNGCTSGHGICGVARGSVRSVAATVTFLGTGALTVFVIHHLLRGTP